MHLEGIAVKSVIKLYFVLLRRNMYHCSVSQREINDLNSLMNTFNCSFLSSYQKSFPEDEEAELMIHLKC